jgi:hypothetical protein
VALAGHLIGLLLRVRDPWRNGERNEHQRRRCERFDVTAGHEGLLVRASDDFRTHPHVHRPGHDRSDP